MWLFDSFRKIIKNKPTNKWGELLGYEPHNVDFFEEAITHRSAPSKNGKQLSKKTNYSNERLEFLGDAVIGLVIADAVYKLYPTANEGFMTKARSKVVCRDNLNKTSHKIGLDKMLHTSRVMKTNAENIYGNAYEALVGAIWLDAGFDKAANFIHKTLVGKDDRHIKSLIDRDVDFKSRILEWGQANKKTILFELVDEKYEAKQDRHTFIYQIRIDDQVVAQAAGTNKILAQQNAAKRALQTMQK